MLNEEYKVELLKKLPIYHRGIYEFKQIAEAQTPEMRALLNAIDFVLDNFYIETATEYGINRFESMMGLTYDEGDTLETRKFRVLTKWNDQIPYTEEVLHELLTILCGKGGYSLYIDEANYALTVKLALHNEKKFMAVKELLDGVVPANMITGVTIYNTYITLASYTHEQLSQYTYEGLKTAVLT